MAEHPIDSSAALDISLSRIVEVLTPSAQDWAARKAKVSQHVQRLTQQLNSPLPITICTFGSSLSGLCLADSDVDLGLFGRFNGCLLESLRPHQQQALLKKVLEAILKAKLAKHKVQAIWGARVPVLKYTCALSGLDCDISLQGTGALVKAHFMAILHTHSTTLGPLYRLIKLWAAAHDLNDASRSTFNSTSLLYMCIFYLQQLRLLPAMADLVPPELLPNPEARLLQGANRHRWENRSNLEALLAATTDRVAAWASQQQQQQQGVAAPRLCELLRGFFQLWSGQLADWVLGRNRELHANLWHGTWTPGSFAKPYIFSLQDPFDATDCPARAVGSETNSNGGTAAFIAYMLSSSSSVLQRYADNCSSAHLLGPAHAAWAGTNSVTGDETAAAAAAAAVAGSHHQRLQGELCKVLAWLFGPQAVLLLSPHHSTTSSSSSSSVPVSHSCSWALSPFQHSLESALRQLQLQRQKPGVLLTWLVAQLGAAIDPQRNVMCLNQLSLLTRKSMQAPAAAAAAAAAVGMGVGASDDGAAGDTCAAATAAAAAGSGSARVAVAAVAVASEHKHHHQQQQKQAQQQQQHDRQHHVEQQQEQQEQEQQEQEQQEPSQPQQQQQQHSGVALDGPPLQQPDPYLLSYQQELASELHQLEHKLRQQPGRASPKRLPKAVKSAVQRSITDVLLRLKQLQQQQNGSSSSSGSGSSRCGLMAVLQQHGFTPLLEHWTFIQNGVLWEQLLPPGFGSSASSSSSTGAGASAGLSAAAAAAAAAHTPAASSQSAAPSNSSSSSSGRNPDLVLYKMLGKKKSINSKDPVQCLKALYKLTHKANLQQLAAAGGEQAHPQVATALAAAALGRCRFSQAGGPGWGPDKQEEQQQGQQQQQQQEQQGQQVQQQQQEQQGQQVQQQQQQQGQQQQQQEQKQQEQQGQLQQQQQQRYAVVKLPELLLVKPGPNGVLTMLQLTPDHTVRQQLKTQGSAVVAEGSSSSSSSSSVGDMNGAPRCAARAALTWLGQQPGVVEAAAAALELDQPKQQTPAQQQQKADQWRLQKLEQKEKQQQQQPEQKQQQPEQKQKQQQPEQKQKQQPKQQLVKKFSAQGLDVRVVARVPQQLSCAAAGGAAASASAAAAATSDTAAAAAAAATSAAAVAEMAQRPDPQQQYQQGTKQHQEPLQPLPPVVGQPAAGTAAAAAAVADLAAGVYSLSFGLGPSSEQPAGAAAVATSAADDAARAKNRASRQLNNLQAQIRSLQNRIQQKEKQLQANEEMLAELEQEEAAALRTAADANKHNQKHAGSSSKAAAHRAAGSSAGSSSSAYAAGAADGMLLLDLAMQQSTDEWMKELRVDVNNARSKVRASREALRQFSVNLQKLRQEEAAAEVVLQQLAAAGAACSSGAESDCQLTDTTL